MKSPAGKARNRTLANKVVKEAWDEVTRAVAKRMGEEVDERPVKAAPAAPVVVKKAPVAAVETVEESKPEADSGTPAVVVGEPKRLSKRAERAAKGAAKALLPKPGMDPGRKALLAAAAQDGSEADGEDSDGGMSDADDDADVLRELARLGSGSDGSGSDDDGPQSGSDGEFDDGFASDDSAAAAPPPPPAKKARREDPSAKRKPPTSSAFLPSLAGGYISYSDSDGEDAKWVKEAEKGDKTERKNRRGQRARRAYVLVPVCYLLRVKSCLTHCTDTNAPALRIWEQKYGSGANHIVKDIGGLPAAQKGGKAGAKLTKKAARSTAAPVEVAAPGFDPMKAGGANAQPVLERVVRPIKIEQGMHPSWEAKRRAAEVAQNLAAAPKGKKITF